ncbi:hypothetical protein AOQ84DRAFT_223435 [Glonium stellatum]|uniref:Zn(2)-C6 fungal-type domain-containing protein n=1 Tax=Glonium stellatum TaxID=574774 RepID=A0A8E2JRD4_9PEZI|nr:hypothetical protein AOQ84DRAFT_223435 [Glonium stellatum]
MALRNQDYGLLLKYTADGVNASLTDSIWASQIDGFAIYPGASGTNETTEARGAQASGNNSELRNEARSMASGAPLSGAAKQSTQKARHNMNGVTDNINFSSTAGLSIARMPQQHAVTTIPAAWVVKRLPRTSNSLAALQELPIVFPSLYIFENLHNGTFHFAYGVGSFPRFSMHQYFHTRLAPCRRCREEQLACDGSSPCIQCMRVNRSALQCGAENIQVDKSRHCDGTLLQAAQWSFQPAPISPQAPQAPGAHSPRPGQAVWVPMNVANHKRSDQQSNPSISVFIVANHVLGNRALALLPGFVVVPVYENNIPNHGAHFSYLTRAGIRVPIPSGRILARISENRVMMTAPHPNSTSRTFVVRTINRITAALPDQFPATGHNRPAPYSTPHHVDLRCILANALGQGGFDNSCYELICFFPNHYKWYNFALTLDNYGWRYSTLAAFICWSRLLRGREVIHPNSVGHHFREARKTINLANPPPPHTYGPSTWRSHSGALTDFLLTDLALGVAIECWPQGSDRRELAQCIECALNHQDRRLRLSQAIALSHQLGFVMNCHPKNLTPNDYNICLNRFHDAFRAYVTNVVNPFAAFHSLPRLH